MSRKDGDEFRDDHLYVQYQIPADTRSLPLVLVHGGGTTGKTWETTPDGRDGFQNLLVRLGFSVYIVDLPGCGRARGTARVPRQTGGAVAAWNVWRLGQWAPPGERTFFETLQFPTDGAVVDQFLRQRAGPGGGHTAETRRVATTALCVLLDRVGPCVLVTHSNGAQFGWLVRTRHDNVRGIVAYEPGKFVFSEDGIPNSAATSRDVARANEPIVVSADEFARLAEVPVQLVYGDNIQRDQPSRIHGVEFWRVNSLRAEQFATELKRRRGDAEVVHLPHKGLHGNTHFPFSDLNNADVARLLVEFLTSRGLA